MKLVTENVVSFYLFFHIFFLICLYKSLENTNEINTFITRTNYLTIIDMLILSIYLFKELIICIGD